MTDWRPIPGWEGLYEASADGQIRSLDRTVVRNGARPWRQAGRTLAQITVAKSYRSVNLFRGGARTRVYVHHLIALTFIGPRPPGLLVCHNDGDPSNNAAANLRYDTASENQFDMARHGTHHEANKTECKHGHPFDQENTGYRKDIPNRRVCITCARRRGKAYRERRSAQRRLAREASA